MRSRSSMRDTRADRRRDRGRGRDGVSDFSALQDALKHGKADRFVYYVFDLLHLDGADLTGQPLIERKAALAKLLKGTDRNGVVRYSEHFDDQRRGRCCAHACELNLEGVISKRRDAPYRSGRNDNWIKSKCGQIPGIRHRRLQGRAHLKGAIGALVLGYYEDGRAALCGPLRHRLHGRDRARSLEEAPAAAPRRAGVRETPGRGARPQGHLGRAEAGRRDRVPRLDGAEACAPRGVQGPARGQARAGNRAGDADADQRQRRNRRESRKPRREGAKAGATAGAGEIHPSGPHLLDRRRDHQAAARATTTPPSGTTWRRMW